MCDDLCRFCKQLQSLWICWMRRNAERSPISIQQRPRRPARLTIAPMVPKHFWYDQTWYPVWEYLAIVWPAPKNGVLGGSLAAAISISLKLINVGSDDIAMHVVVLAMLSDLWTLSLCEGLKKVLLAASQMAYQPNAITSWLCRTMSIKHDFLWLSQDQSPVVVMMLYDCVPS